MNRIILIGNGFDLAHEKKTSYKHFINDYWDSAIKSIKEANNKPNFENSDFFIEHAPSSSLNAKNYDELIKSLKFHKKRIDFKNIFLKVISEKSYIEKWIDIENEYYTLLKQTLNDKESSNDKYNVEQLNKDFERIKELLIEYLFKIEEKYRNNPYNDFSNTRQVIGEKIYRPFRFKDFSENSKKYLLESILNTLSEDIENIKNDKVKIEDIDERNRKIINQIDINKPLYGLNGLLKSSSSFEYFDLVPEQTLFLNFNYTFTDFNYYKNPEEFQSYENLKQTKPKFIHIHGTIIKNNNNPIIFGYGDEIDEDYKLIERANKNEYLENIKSINYLHTENYKKLLEFINEDIFQVFIFGHSCGISDRTLLNSIFEHANCASVKVFFHQIDSITDNFSDIIRNISRNFNDKAKMRDRVVNKTYCEPLL